MSRTIAITVIIKAVTMPVCISRGMSNIGVEELPGRIGSIS